MSDKIFTLSVEPVEGETYQHPFHLGTQWELARTIAEERFRATNHHRGLAKTVALKREGKIFDVFDGEWASDRANRMWDEINEADRQMIEDSAA